MNWTDLKPLFDLTLDLMNRFGVPIRDTWSISESGNLDDYLGNGNLFYGPRLIKLEYLDSGMTALTREKFYDIKPDFKHYAYDRAIIKVNKNFKNFNHPIVHEIVHYLQENWKELHESYIRYDGNNFDEYRFQKIELEALFIQIAFICIHEKNALDNLPLNHRRNIEIAFDGINFSNQSGVKNLIRLFYDYKVF